MLSAAERIRTCETLCFLESARIRAAFFLGNRKAIRVVFRSRRLRPASGVLVLAIPTVYLILRYGLKKTFDWLYTCDYYGGPLEQRAEILL